MKRISSTGKIVKTSKLIDKGTNIYQLSNEIEAYRNGFVLSEINAIEQYVEFTNGLKLDVGEVVGNTTMMRIYVEFKFVKLFIHISIRKLVCSKEDKNTILILH